MAGLVLCDKSGLQLGHPKECPDCVPILVPGSHEWPCGDGEGGSEGCHRL